MHTWTPWRTACGPCDKRLGEDYPIRIAFCTGPAGEDIELFQER